MWGLDGDPNIQIKDVSFYGLVQSPYAYTIGDGTIEDGEGRESAYYINTNYNPASMVGGIGSRAPGAAIDFGTDDIYKNIPVITP
jgi:hypothetical protein